MKNKNINSFVCVLPISTIENIIRNNLPFHDIFFDIKTEDGNLQKITIFILEEEENSIINYKHFYFYISNKELSKLKINEFFHLSCSSLEALLDNIERTTNVISKLTKALSLTYKNDSSITYNSYLELLNIYIYFPYIEVTNKHKSLSIMREVYVCLKYNLRTFCFESTLYLTRTLVTEYEDSTKTFFSHTKIRSDLPETPSNCCLGDTGLAQSICELAISKQNFNMNLLIGTLFQIEEYLKYESLEGGPYSYMRDTINKEIRNYYQSVIGNNIFLINSSEILILILDVLKSSFISFLKAKEYLKEYVENHYYNNDLVYDFLNITLNNNDAVILYNAIKDKFPERVEEIEILQKNIYKAKESDNLYSIKKAPRKFDNKANSHKIGIKFKGESLIYKVVPSILQNEEEFKKYVSHNLIQTNKSSSNSYKKIITDTVQYVDSFITINKIIGTSINEYIKENNNQQQFLKII